MNGDGESSSDDDDDGKSEENDEGMSEGQRVFGSLAHNSPLLAAFKGKSFDICLISMCYKKSYTFEIAPQLRGFVVTPQCRRIFHQLIQALSTNSGAIIHGP